MAEVVRDGSRSRALFRMPVTWPVTWSEGQALRNGTIRDVSVRGMFVEVDQREPVRIGQQVWVGFSIPGGNQTREDGTVRWVGHNPAHDCIGFGLECSLPSQAIGAYLRARDADSVQRVVEGSCHEIKNALNAILINVGHTRDVLAQRADAPELQVLLRDAYDAALMIRGLTGDLMTHTAPTLEHAPVKLDNIIRSAVGMQTGMLRLAGAGIELRLQDAVTVMGCERQLKQVFLNLIGNAAQALEQVNRKQKRIWIVSEAGASGTVVRIADNGPGLPEEFSERVFQPFFSTRRADGGTGLGLSISRDIVRAHGGTLTVEPNPGRGACFIVQLPPGSGASSPRPAS